MQLTELVHHNVPGDVSEVSLSVDERRLVKFSWLFTITYHHKIISPHIANTIGVRNHRRVK